MYYRSSLEKGEKGYDPTIVDGKDLRSRIVDPDSGTGVTTDPTFVWSTNIEHLEYDPDTEHYTIYTTEGWYLMFGRDEILSMLGLK